MPLSSGKTSLAGRVRAAWAKADLRLAAGVVLLAIAASLTWMTVDGLSTRYRMRVELAEISHVRYELMNVDVWIEKVIPILERKIDALDLTAADKARLRPTVQGALYGLLNEVERKMSAPPAAKQGVKQAAAAFLSPSNPMVMKMIMGALRPRVPEFADVVIAELTKDKNKQAFKAYAKDTLIKAAKDTYGNVDRRWYSWILEEHGCADAAGCRDRLSSKIAAADARLNRTYLGALGASALAFVLLLTGAPVLTRLRTVVLLLFCLTLLLGGILTPMIEVEARLTNVGMTLLGEKITFPDQTLYFQSKSVLEVFDALIKRREVDMFVVGVLVLMFSVIFPALKLSASAACLFKPDLVKNREVRFFVLESSKWSMADVMALAIFMAYVAMNGLIGNTLGGLQGMGIPTDSSKILPGYHIFIGFCLASLFLAKKLARGIRYPE